MSMYDELIKAKAKAWGAPDMMEGANRSRGKKLPFSSPLLNWQTYGGIPRDKITEFFGNPGAGKSTTSIDICKNSIDVFREEWEEELLRLRENQTTKEAKLRLSELEESGPRKVLYIDLEHSFDSEWADTLGIDPTEIEIMQPPDVAAEQILRMVMEMVETNEVGLIVLDSIPSLVTQAELDKQLGERTVASLAGLLTVFCRKIVPKLTRHRTTLLVINQTRDNMDNPFVVNTPGGRALKFYSSLRMEFMLGSPVDIMGNELPQKTEDPAGYLIKTREHKQKSAPFDRKNASYYLICDQGIKPEMDYAKLAQQRYGLIKKAAAWFSFIDPYTGEFFEIDGKIHKVNGMPAVFKFLEEHPEYFDRLKKYIEDDINGIESEYFEETDEIEDLSEDEGESLETPNTDQGSEA